MSKEGKNIAPGTQRSRPKENASGMPDHTVYYEDGSRYEPGIGFLDEDGYLVGSPEFWEGFTRPTITIV